MLDCEFERMEAGWLMEEGRKGRAADRGSDPPILSVFTDPEESSPRHTTSSGMSVWDYIEKYHKKSPVFYNFMYSPADQETVSYAFGVAEIL